LFREKNKLDIIEKIVLSTALSFGIAGITGLFLGLLIEFSFTTITVSLSSITIILSITAFILKNKDIKNSGQQTPSAKTINQQ